MLNWNVPNLSIVMILLIAWEGFWKGIALWKTAKRNETWWFIAIFVINFFGVVPIFYLWKTKQLDTVLKDFQGFFKSKFNIN